MSSLVDQEYPSIQNQGRQSELPLQDDNGENQGIPMAELKHYPDQSK